MCLDVADLFLPFLKQNCCGRQGRGRPKRKYFDYMHMLMGAASFDAFRRMAESCRDLCKILVATTRPVLQTKKKENNKKKYEEEEEEKEEE